jgi:ubiquinone/menaquinone biosynthesis C-methylase UbiE
MPELDLLTALPKSKRNVQARSDGKSSDVVAVSKQFGFEYFDGARDYGYGGYRYDGRWVPVARDIIDHYGLEPGMSVLDVGCAKGFLVKDLIDACPGLDVVGLDISHYALTHSVPDARGKLVRGECDRLPFSDGRFDLVVSLDTIHNLPRDGVLRSLREFQRVGKGRGYIRVDSYHSPEQRAVFESWVLTAEFHDYPAGWEAVFAEAGYTGDWTWTIIE